MSEDICECPKCGRQHRNLGFGKPPSVMKQIARDMREGTFPNKSEQTLREEQLTYGGACELKRLREALQNILEARDDNQPAALNMPDLEYARSIIKIIHRTARGALGDAALSRC